MDGRAGDDDAARVSGQREADNRLSAISAMLTWCVDRGKLTVNHLRGFKRLYHVDRSEVIWLPEHIDTFMKVAPLEMQRALILALHTGQRKGTCCACLGRATRATTSSCDNARRAVTASRRL